MFRAMPAERTREHTVPVAAARRRRLRADQARQLADLLRHQILAGGYPTGVLPLEGTLATDYGAGRNTVRQALDLLRGEQLVERRPAGRCPLAGLDIRPAGGHPVGSPVWHGAAAEPTLRG